MRVWLGEKRDIVQVSSCFVSLGKRPAGTAQNIMYRKATWLIILFFIPVILNSTTFNSKPKGDEDYISYELDMSRQQFKLYWKDDKQQIFKSILSLKNWLDAKKEQLLFAMNAGMYKEDNSPLGLYIENYKTITKLNTRSATGNFYLKPNGVFYVTGDGKAFICKTTSFKADKNIKYATQSGPMLLIDGNIHPSFTKGSININIRNGVGILPNGNALFAMSKSFVNFYDFADYFKKKGCKNALFLDGSICRTYAPGSNWVQTGGNFGVIIGITKK